MNYLLSNNRWLLRTIGRMHKNIINNQIEENGMGKVSHPVILLALREKFDQMTASQKEIAEYIGVKAPTVALSVKRMVQSGLLRKVTDSDDMRRNNISLTDKGIEHLEKCKLVMDNIDNNLFKGFSEKEMSQLENMFIRMIKNLENMGVQVPKDLEIKLAKDNSLHNERNEG